MLWPRPRLNDPIVEPIARIPVAYMDATSSHRKQRETPMGSTTDKIKGMANEAAGNVKQAAGKAMNKPEWEAEGKAQELKGEAQQALGKGKDAVKKAVDKV